MPSASGVIADFVHLRVHSAYSLSEGAIRVKRDKDADKAKDKHGYLIERCVAEGMAAVAVDRHRQSVRRAGILAGGG